MCVVDWMKLYLGFAGYMRAAGIPAGSTKLSMWVATGLTGGQASLGRKEEGALCVSRGGMGQPYVAPKPLRSTLSQSFRVPLLGVANVRALLMRKTFGGLP